MRAGSYGSMPIPDAQSTPVVRDCCRPSRYRSADESMSTTSRAEVETEFPDVKRPLAVG